MNAKIGALFAGYGGLDMAVTDVLGAELAWVSENEATPSRILAHHYPHVPNHGDITRISWSDVAPVDVLTAGYPCQPFSNAGQRKGTDDERHLWSQVERTICDLRPGLVVLENVAAHVNRGFCDVLGSLAGLGFNAEWTCLRASDVGAPHARFRVFVVAWIADSKGEGLEERRNGELAQRAATNAGRKAVGLWAGLRAGEPGWVGWRRPDDDGAPVPVADAASDGRHERRTESARHERGHDAAECGAAAADADGDGLESVGRVGSVGRDTDRRDGARQEIAWGAYGPAIERWERTIGRVAPPPTEPGRNGAQRLSPRFVEWMQGLPDGWVTDVPNLARNEQLKALGNGVVPQQAAEAMRRLLAPEVQGVAA